MNVLCIATYFKGETFLEACHRLGHRVYLLTAEDLKDEPWPREHIEDIFYLPGDEDSWRREDLIAGVSYLARTIKFDRIVPLDDFDLEKAALLREHLRIPGMGDTRTRYFRDKLAMRTQARDHGIPVPAFVHVLNYDEIRRFARSVPAPWVLKPRSSASAAGIKKIHSEAQLWTEIEKLGDEQSFYLLEQFIPGDIYHVDAIVFGEEVVFARAHRYLDPPLQVAHEGGIFATANIPYDAPEETSLLQMNADVIRAMGLRAGVSHTEFIRAGDGQLFFLETSARVGGAHIAEMLEASSGVNLWAEWARIETLPAGETYQLPPIRRDYSGVIISLARQEHPDLSGYTDPEIVWRLNKPFHAGLIVRSSSYDRVQSLLRSYIDRFYRDFFASVPAPEKPTS
jgi:biotin carboxylase